MISHPACDVTGRRVAAVALRNARMLPIGVAAVACGLTPPFAHEAALGDAHGAWRGGVPPTIRGGSEGDVLRVARIFPFQRWRVGARPARRGRDDPIVRVPARPWVWSEWARGGVAELGDGWAKRRGRRRWDRQDAVARARSFCRRRRGQNESARRRLRDGGWRREEVEEEEETTGDSARRRRRTRRAEAENEPEPTLGRLEPFFVLSFIECRLVSRESRRPGRRACPFAMGISSPWAPASPCEDAPYGVSR